LPSQAKPDRAAFRRRLTSRSDVKRASPAGRSHKKSAMTRRVVLGFAEPGKA
jgi:hypothetical protein